ncbi:MAG: hypothetical protein AB1898_15690 [Acidobacteriota bacterium]
MPDSAAPNHPRLLRAAALRTRGRNDPLAARPNNDWNCEVAFAGRPDDALWDAQPRQP